MEGIPCSVHLKQSALHYEYILPQIKKHTNPTSAVRTWSLQNFSNDTILLLAETILASYVSNDVTAN